MSMVEDSSKKRCGVYWDLGDTSLISDSIKDTLYLVRSVCQSNNLEVVSVHLVVSVETIPVLGDDLRSIKLIYLPDYSKASACDKISHLIEQFLGQTEPGCPIILIDPNSLVNPLLNSLSTRYDFEIYFIHLERTFDPSLEPVADNHFYLEGSSIYPIRPLTIADVGTLEVKDYPPSIDTFNLILEIDHLFKSYGRIENSTFSPPELPVVWVFFPSQQLALNAASETRKTLFRGSLLSIDYLVKPPCSIADHPILASLIESNRDPSTDKIGPDGDDPENVSKDPGPSDDAVRVTETVSPNHQDTAGGSGSTNSVTPRGLPEADRIFLDVAETLSQLSSNSPLNISAENTQPTGTTSSSNTRTEQESRPTPAIPSTRSIPSSAILVLPFAHPKSSEVSSETATRLPSKPGPSNLNVSKSSDGRSDGCSTSGVSSKSDRSIGVIAIHGRPKGVDEKKFFCDMNGTFKKFGRLEGASFLHDDSVLLGFKDDQVAEKVAKERNGMTYFGVPLTVAHIEKPTPNMMAMMNSDTVQPKQFKTTFHHDPNLIVAMRSLKRSAAKPTSNIKSVTDIGAIAISNIPRSCDLRTALADLNGMFKSLGAITDSAIWFKGNVWICYPDKRSAQSAAVKADGMNFRKTKLTVNYIESPPNFLLENHFIYLLTPKSPVDKPIPKNVKRVKRSSTKGSVASGSTKSSCGSKIYRPSVQSNQSSKSGNNKPNGSSNAKKSKSGSNTQSGKQLPPSGSKASSHPQHSSPIQFARKSQAKDKTLSSENLGQSQVRMEEDRCNNDLVDQLDSSNGSNGGTSVSIVDGEGSITYCQKMNRSCEEKNLSLESFDSVEDYMASEAVIYPLDGLAADTRFDYYQSTSYHNHDYADLIRDALRPEQFVVFKEINFKVYPNKFWLLLHVLRMVWPNGVMKLAHIKDEIYILMVTEEGAAASVEMFNQLRETSEGPTIEPFLSLRHLKASIPVSVPSAILTLITLYSATYSPWCFTKNWDLRFLDLQAKGFVSASEFSLSKGIVSGLGALFIKSQDSKLTVAFPSEKRLIHTMFAMRRSIIANFDFHTDPEYPDDLLTLIRDYDLTGSCARLSQIALQQTFKLLKYQNPPPFKIYKDAHDDRLSIETRCNGKIEVNFNAPSARSCETVAPISESIASASTAEEVPASTSEKESDSSADPINRLNYFISIHYNARHIWCYMYDVLSKLWPYRIFKIIYKQEHRSQKAETWLEVPWHVIKDDIVNRLSTLTYIESFKIEVIVRPSFDMVNQSVSTGSSPWLFSDSLQLKLVKIVPNDQSHPQRDVSLYVEKVKYIVEDELAIFVKLMSNAIWVAFPDRHSMYQGILLINHEQRIEPNLMAVRADDIPKELFQTINIEDLVGVAKDLAIANSLPSNDFDDQ